MIQFKNLIIITFLFLPALIHAQSVDELKNKISERNTNIKQLEEEIRGYQGQIDSLGKEADSLKNTIAGLDLSQRKLAATLAVTQNKIESTNLQIKELSLQISDKSTRIQDGKRVITQSFSAISQIDSSSVLETLLSSHSLAEIWNNTEQLTVLQAGVRDRIIDLRTTKSSLEDNKKNTEQKKKELVTLQKDLGNQKKIIAETVKEKNSLLVSTKNTEINYKKILATKEAQKEAFEREVLAFESALRIAIDPSKIPRSGSGILLWPLDKIRITQYFGTTAFSTANPQVYNGKGHTGVDFAASIGTPVMSALTGTVVGVANTDIVRSCYSYGKWVMVRHANGLSTLYAHLSLQTVAVGDTVATGQIIGYSGNSGYSTGPHLHFGVYATEGVRITTVTRSAFPGSGCIGATTVFSDPKAYLNPLSFL